MSFTSKTQSSSCGDENGLKRGPWTTEEDTLLVRYIGLHGEGRWNLLAKRSGLRRTGKSCRLRWLNYLKPDVKRGNLTPKEQLLILDLHTKWGNRWSKIAQRLPGRTDNEIKNYWRTRVQKQAKHLNVDANSTEFQQLIRCFWMPRLLQKMEPQLQSSSSEEFFSQSLSSSDQLLDPDSQNSGPPPLPLPQLLPPVPTPEASQVPLQGLLYRNNQNPEVEFHSTSTSSSESFNMPSLLSEDSTYLHHYSSEANYCSTFIKGHGFEMGTLNLATTSAPGDFGYPVGDFQAAETTNWADNDFGACLWNLDEFSLFRN